MSNTNSADSSELFSTLPVTFFYKPKYSLTNVEYSTVLTKAQQGEGEPTGIGKASSWDNCLLGVDLMLQAEEGNCSDLVWVCDGLYSLKTISAIAAKSLSPRQFWVINHSLILPRLVIDKMQQDWSTWCIFYFSEPRTTLYSGGSKDGQ